VALLRLLEPASLDQSGFINAVCLPSGGRSLPVGSVCLAAGWGKLGKSSLYGLAYDFRFNCLITRSATQLEHVSAGIGVISL